MIFADSYLDMSYPLRSKALQILHRMLRAILQKLSYHPQTLVVGDMCRRFLLEWAAVEVVGEVCLDHRGRDGSADGEGIEDHCSML